MIFQRWTWIVSTAFFTLSCASFNHRTIVENEAPEKAKTALHISVVYLTSGKISFGNIVTKPAEPAEEWEISKVIEDSVRKNLESVGKQMDSFSIATVENGQVPVLHADSKSDTLIIIRESSFWQQDCYYSGIGILMDKRKRLFQTVIQPFAMLDVAVKFKNDPKPLHALNSRYIGKFGGSTAPNVGSVSFHDTLAEFPPNERALLKNALHQRLEVVINALFSDLGFGKATN